MPAKIRPPGLAENTYPLHPGVDYPSPLRSAPAILLSAAELPPNEERAGPNRPDLVLDATMYLARFASNHGVHLVMRSEAALTPLALSEARRCQGEVFAIHEDPSFPPACLEVSDWSHGTFLPAQASRVRQLLINAPSVIAGVFIGGGDAVEGDYDEFRKHSPNRPVYPIGSTGSAADAILGRKDPVGRNIDREVLATSPSYPLVMRHIFADLNELIARFRPER
jgi:hypothetical protein